jgi:hypothetical protein
MRRTVLNDQCRNRLYPILSMVSFSGKFYFSATKPSTEQWHEHLGHPSFKVIRRVLSDNCLPFHYVINSNRRHGSETCTKTIVSDLEKNERRPHHQGVELARWRVKRRQPVFQRILVKLISEMCPLL